MKVAILSPYPRAAVHTEHGLGGVAAYTKNLVDGMRGRAEVVVMAPVDHAPTTWRDGDVVVIEIERSPAGISRALRAIARDPEIEAVHVQFEQHLFGGPIGNARLALALRALRRTKRIVLTLHQVPDLADVDRAFLARNGFPPLPVLARAWMRLQYVLMAAACHLMIVHEARLAAILREAYRVDPARVAVVPHGVDAGALPCDRAEAKRRLGAEGLDVVLYFGYVTGYKGVDLLAEALAQIPEARRARTRVIIAGKVPERKLENAAFRAEIQALERAIAALGPWVERKGFLSPNDIALHLAAADVVVFPYRNVFAASGPMCITIGHARPFLASAGFRGMGVPDEALFETNATALASKILAFLDDGALRGRLEAEAQRLAREHSWPNVALRTLALYARRAPRVLLMGAYGQDNLGDEALLEVHLQQLRDMDLVVASSNHHQTTLRYATSSVATYGGLRTLSAFLHSDVVVFGGGSVMKELPRPYPRHRVVASLALLSTLAHGIGRGVAYSGVGVEKLGSRTGRVLVRQAGRAADLMHVRDEGSRQLLRSIGVRERVRLVADAVYLLREDEAAAARAQVILAPVKDRPVVVVNVMSAHEVRAAASDVTAAFVALINEIHETLDAHVILLPFKTRGEDNDVGVMESIALRVARPASVSLAPLDLRPAEAIAILRRSDFSVAMRHHAVLMSLVADTPVLAVPYAPKTQHLIEEFRLEESSIPVECVTPSTLPETFRRAYSRRSEQRRDSRGVLVEMQARASENFASLRRFLLSRERS